MSLSTAAESSADTICNKDTGAKQKCLQKWSRGLLHFVRGGGHRQLESIICVRSSTITRQRRNPSSFILSKNSCVHFPIPIFMHFSLFPYFPLSRAIFVFSLILFSFHGSLFRSESPGQVFLLAVHSLYNRLKNVEEKYWEEMILSYDNMCNVCRMVSTKKPLPLPAPYDQIWLKITKVIDRLHLRNHKKRCHEEFSPEPLKVKYPQLNTPVAEQTFTWAARFKKILCAMPQERFLFYYHRMVVRRNAYTSKCHRESRTPVLPKVRSQFTT